MVNSHRSVISAKAGIPTGPLPNWPLIGQDISRPPVKTANPDYATLEEIDQIKKTADKRFFDTITQTPMERLRQQCARATEGGHKEIQGMAAVLAIHDPAGIAMDLAAMVDWRLAWFNEDQRQRREREIVTGGIIESIRESVMYHAEAEPILRARENLKTQLARSRKPPKELLAYYNRDYEQNVKRFREPEARAKRRGDAWKKYAKRYDTERVNKDIQDARDELADFNKLTIDRIALAHNGWMRSVDLANYFECNFDPKSIESGRLYTAVFTLCIGNMQQCITGLDLLYRWIDGDVLDRTCLLLRAMILNQDMRAKALAAAVGEIGDGKKYLGLDKQEFDQIGLYKDLLEKTGEAFGRSVIDDDPNIGLLATLASRAGAALAQRVRDHYRNQGIVRVDRLPRFLLNFSGMMRTPVVVVNVAPSLERQVVNIRRPIYNIAQANGMPFTRAQINAEMETFLHPLRQQGLLNRATPQTEVLAFDAERFARLAANHRPNTIEELRNAYQETLRLTSREDVRQQRTNYAQEAAGTGAIGVGGALFSVAISVFQYINFLNALETFSKSPNVKPLYRDEDFQKLTASTINMAMAVSDTVERVITGLAGHTRLGGRVGRSLHAFNNSWVVRGAGVFAALIMVGWDFVHMLKARDNGQTGLALAYLASAILGAVGIGLTIAGWYYTAAAAAGVAGAAATAAALSIYGLILLAVVVVVGLIIAWLLGDSLQQWLERCYYGTFQEHKDSEKYDFGAEIAAFQRIQESAKKAAANAPKEPPLSDAEEAEMDRLMALPA